MHTYAHTHTQTCTHTHADIHVHTCLHLYIHSLTHSLKCSECLNKGWMCSAGWGRLCQSLRLDWVPPRHHQRRAHGQEVPVAGVIWGGRGHGDPEANTSHPESCLQCGWLWDIVLCCSFCLWNSLRSEVRCIHSATADLTDLKTHLFKSYCC